MLNEFKIPKQQSNEHSTKLTILVTSATQPKYLVNNFYIFTFQEAF